MTSRLPRSLRLVLLGSALALGACAPVATEEPTSRAAAVGRVEGIEVQHGYLIAVFPSGRMNVSMDKRQLQWYIVGDEIRIDSYGRPLPRR